MSDIQTEKVSDFIKTMTPDEMAEAVKQIPSLYLWAELMRRESVMTGMLSQITAVMECREERG